jgi:hypothetical protein
MSSAGGTSITLMASESPVDATRATATQNKTEIPTHDPKINAIIMVLLLSMSNASMRRAAPELEN